MQEQESEVTDIKIDMKSRREHAPDSTGFDEEPIGVADVSCLKHDIETELKFLSAQPWKDGPFVYLNLPESEPWETLKRSVGKYDEGMCKGWREDLDTMLVFVRRSSMQIAFHC